MLFPGFSQQSTGEAYHMKSAIALQQILGTDKRNPVFTVCRDGVRGVLHVYYGGE
jgi:hypothetical protein